ncbi:MAG: hypothetical protein Q8942_05425 [Bacillota bacterium]|nr:hypothetical protein [Bacillota bacterium]
MFFESGGGGIGIVVALSVLSADLRMLLEEQWQTAAHCGNLHA